MKLRQINDVETLHATSLLIRAVNCQQPSRWILQLKSRTAYSLLITHKYKKLV